MSILDFIKPDVKVIDIGTRGDMTIGASQYDPSIPQS